MSYLRPPHKTPSLACLQCSSFSFIINIIKLIIATIIVIIDLTELIFSCYRRSKSDLQVKAQCNPALEHPGLSPSSYQYNHRNQCHHISFVIINNITIILFMIIITPISISSYRYRHHHNQHHHILQLHHRHQYLLGTSLRICYLINCASTVKGGRGVGYKSRFTCL